MINPLIFRMYDIRGTVGRDIDPRISREIGRGAGTYLRSRYGKRIVVGRDNRESSPLLEEALVEGLASSGMDIVRIGLASSPLMYFAVARWGLDGGVHVTASHNPVEYNGFKVVARRAVPVAGEDLQELARVVLDGHFDRGAGKVEERSPVEEYMVELKRHARLSGRMSVVVDAGNGVAGMLAPRLLRELGCRVRELYCELDGRFPNHVPDPEPEENTRELARMVVTSGADLGLGYDGDVDRVAAVDEKGRRYHGDSLLLVLARDYLTRHPGARVLFDVKSSQNLIDGITRAGGVPMMWKTGHSLIKKKMWDEGIELGGEVSGHMYIGEDYYGFDDALLASCKLLTIVSGAGKPLSALMHETSGRRSTPEVKVRCSDEDKFEVVGAIKAYFESRYDTIDLDGVRIKFPDGWALVRASNTNPILTLRFEADSQDALERIEREVYGKLREFKSVGFS